jgi:hypothetical protein
MRDGVRLMLVAIVCACTACTTRSYTPDSANETRQLKVGVGDEIRVVTTSRDRISFRVGEVRDDRFVGVTLEPYRKETRPADTPVEVPYADVAMIEVTRFDKKAAAAVGGVVIFTVALGTLVLTGVPLVVPPP